MMKPMQDTMELGHHTTLSNPLMQAIPGRIIKRDGKHTGRKKNRREKKPSDRVGDPK